MSGLPDPKVSHLARSPLKQRWKYWLHYHRKTEWDTADIMIRHIDPNATSKRNPLVTYGRANGQRQSQRLRQIKDDGKRRHITVRKSSTVKEIKLMVGIEYAKSIAN
jgi:hypothetical protein